MRSIMQRVAPWLLLVSGCSPDQVVLMIHVTNLTPDVTGLQVRAQLDDRPSQQVTYTQKLDTLAVTVAKDNVGPVQLSLRLLGVEPSGCISTGAQFDATIGLSSSYLEIDLPMEPLPHRLCKVPKGSFIMGSPMTEVGRGTDEVQHMVTLTTDFWMADSEVTQKQWQSVMGSNPSNFKSDELPVETFSWFDAVVYCNVLSVKEKLQPCYQLSGTTVGWTDGLKCQGYRLPTEAEWEYAARSPATMKFAGSDDVNQVAWISTNSGPSPGPNPHQVKTKSANGRGLFDLSGNAWEWVWDWYQSNNDSLPPIDPMGPSTGTERGLRGGSWSNADYRSRVACRAHSDPTKSGIDVSLRVVRAYP